MSGRFDSRYERARVTRANEISMCANICSAQSCLECKSKVGGQKKASGEFVFGLSWPQTLGGCSRQTATAQSSICGLSYALASSGEKKNTLRAAIHLQRSRFAPPKKSKPQTNSIQSKTPKTPIGPQQSFIQTSAGRLCVCAQVSVKSESLERTK